MRLRFSPWNDGLILGGLPQACVVGNIVSWICCFFAFVLYASVFNVKESDNKKLFGQFGGGFALILISAFPAPGTVVV